LEDGVLQREPSLSENAFIGKVITGLPSVELEKGMVKPAGRPKGQGLVKTRIAYRLLS